MPATWVVVLDANVLFPRALRDLLLYLDDTGLIRVHWTAEILEETRRNLVGKGTITEERADVLVGLMQESFPGAEVIHYEHHIDQLGNDLKDRHVVAAAVEVGAHAVVTFNLSDFAPMPPRIVAMSPDELMVELWKYSHSEVSTTLEEIRKERKLTLAELLRHLESHAPNWVGLAKNEL